MNERVGDWIQVYTGRAFWPLDPRPEEIYIEDIAHALSMKCRYGGHCLRFYSVAEHSVLVSRHVPAHAAFWGLMHDAAEAYLADIPRPVKRDLHGWRNIEARVMAAVVARFEMTPAEPASVKHVDLAITSDERDALMAAGGPEWGELAPPVGVSIRCWTPTDAKAAFLARFKELA